MTKGVWNDATPGKRSAAARKGASARAKKGHRTRAANKAGSLSLAARLKRFYATGEPVMTAAERAAIEGTQADRVMPVASIAEILARVAGRASGRVPRETIGCSTEYKTTGEVAVICGCSRRRLRTWNSLGDIPHGPSGVSGQGRGNELLWSPEAVKEAIARSRENRGSDYRRPPQPLQSTTLERA